MGVPRDTHTERSTALGSLLDAAGLVCAIATDTPRSLQYILEVPTEGQTMSKLITDEQLAAIHAAQSVALKHGNVATYWALTLALDFALDCGGQDQDIRRTGQALLQEVS